MAEPRVSVIIPVFNAGSTLSRCLDALAKSDVQPMECIVVNDGSVDGSSGIAANSGALVLHTSGRRGPAHARNLGARNARGDLLWFLDSDVCVHAGTLRRIAARFQDGSAVDAVIGSYDDTPFAPEFFSQYRNLLHHYVHQRAGGSVATFWTGCGAIRAEVFAAMAGLDERYATPSIEDIDLGYRMAGAGYRCVLDPSVQVKHLKRWTFRSILVTDVLRRGIPWVKLMLRQRNAPNHLNVSQSERASVALAWMVVVAGLRGSSFSMALILCVLVVLNVDVYRFFLRKRGAWFAVRAAVMHFLYHLYNGISLVAGVCAYGWERIKGNEPAGA